MINITKSHPKYCTDCLFIGYIEAVENIGSFTILVDIEHSNNPIFLKEGLTFPQII